MYSSSAGPRLAVFLIAVIIGIISVFVHGQVVHQQHGVITYTNINGDKE